MTKLLVTGGRQTMSFQRKPEWHLYEEALLVELDTATGSAEAVMNYKTPAGLCPEDDPSYVFKGASFDGDELLVVAQTEVLRVALPSMSIVARYSEPTFNDLHHVRAVGDRIYVVSTGLDAVIVLDRDGNVLENVHVLGHDLWDCFDEKTDYRLIPTTKPHKSHPNHVFETPEGVWVTRISQRDAVLLSDLSRKIDVSAVGPPHDGTLHEGSVWFTTVNGFVAKTNPSTGIVEEAYNLNEIGGLDRPLGWCRGLGFADGVAFVGFSRLRSTKFRENLSWVKRGFKRDAVQRRLPTRVAAYDLDRGQLLQEWDLEETGLGLVFSILPDGDRP